MLMCGNLLAVNLEEKSFLKQKSYNKMSEICYA
jgi:hypothetical protein